MLKLAVATLLVTAAACGGPTAKKDAAREIGTAVCGHVSMCDPSGFHAAYPNGVEQCVAVWVGQICPTGCPGDVANEDQLAICVDAVNASPCPSSGMDMVPLSCNNVLQ